MKTNPKQRVRLCTTVHKQISQIWRIRVCTKSLHYQELGMCTLITVQARNLDKTGMKWAQAQGGKAFWEAAAYLSFSRLSIHPRLDAFAAQAN